MAKTYLAYLEDVSFLTSRQQPSMHVLCHRIALAG